MSLTKKLERRKGALVRLEAQLKSGVKPVAQVKNEFVAYGTKEPLDDHDKKRIQREIATLKERV